MEDEAFLIEKLEMVKEMKSRQNQLDKLKLRLKAEVSQTENEEKCLQDYRMEMELLMQEKMAHVEELRQIHADINAIENIIKQGEEDRNRHLEIAKQINHEYQPLKEAVDKMRHDIGLPRLPELTEEDEKIKPEFFDKPKMHWMPADSLTDSIIPSSILAAQQQVHLPSSTIGGRAKNQNNNDSNNITGPGSGPGGCDGNPLERRRVGEPDERGGGVDRSRQGRGRPPNNPLDRNDQDSGRQAGGGTCGPGSGPGSGPVPLGVSSTNRPMMNPLGGVVSGGGGLLQAGGMGGMGPGPGVGSLMDRGAAAFRQQPPPMKSCLSCHQQIHRNAPICPLCKAKSRSRNPKKPKRKLGED